MGNFAHWDKSLHFIQKFTRSKSHISRNSRFQNQIFSEIYIFKLTFFSKKFQFKHFSRKSGNQKSSKIQRKIIKKNTGIKIIKKFRKQKSSKIRKTKIIKNPGKNHKKIRKTKIAFQKLIYLKKSRFQSLIFYIISNVKIM